MEPSSRTPEGEPTHCPVCGHRVIIEPSDGSFDATCPHCGCLLWFDRAGGLTPDRSLADQSKLEYTKRQIRSLVAEIGHLSRSNITEDEFYREFLPRVVSALAAPGGAVWTANDEGRLALQFQINLKQTNLRESEDSQRRHGHLLHHVIKSGAGALVQPHSLIGDDDESGGNPTDYLVVLGPLKTDVAMMGVVEVFQRPDTGLATQKGYLRFLLQMCEMADGFLARSHPGGFFHT